MKIEYQITLRNYLEFYNTYQKQSSSFWAVWLFWILIGIFFLLLGISDLINDHIILAIINLVIGFLFCFGYKPFLRSEASNYYKKQPHASDVTTLNIIESGLIETKSTIKTEYNWSCFKYFIETENIFILKNMKLGIPALLIAVLIPKKAFETSEGINQFREMLKQNISNDDIQ